MIEMAENSRILEEPLIFILPHPYELNASRPEHPNGTKKVARISLTLPHAAFSDSFSKFRALGLVSVAQGPKPMLSLEFDTLGSAIHHDFQPLLPLELKW